MYSCTPISSNPHTLTRVAPVLFLGINYVCAAGQSLTDWVEPADRMEPGRLGGFWTHQAVFFLSEKWSQKLLKKWSLLGQGTV